MKTFFTVLSVLFLFAFTAPMASANGGGSGDCANGKICDCLKKGICGRPHGYAECRVKIFAPTYGGKVTLDLRRKNGTSLFDDGRPRKPDRVPPGGIVPEGIVKFTVGCGIVEQAYQAYMCADGGEVAPHSVSIRWRYKGDFTQVISTRKLEMCLLGDKCPRFIPGPPPEM